jgi:hypothetical protein
MLIRELIAFVYSRTYEARVLTTRLERSPGEQAPQQIRNSPHFMEIGGLLPCLLISATCPYLEPDECSPRRPVV